MKLPSMKMDGTVRWPVRSPRYAWRHQHGRVHWSSCSDDRRPTASSRKRTCHSEPSANWSSSTTLRPGALASVFFVFVQ